MFRDKTWTPKLTNGVLYAKLYTFSLSLMSPKGTFHHPTILKQEYNDTKNPSRIKLPRFICFQFKNNKIQSELLKIDFYLMCFQFCDGGLAADRDTDMRTPLHRCCSGHLRALRWTASLTRSPAAGTTVY